jgi:hypothetical protein
MFAAILIFSLTYLVMAVGRMPGLHLDRTGAAIIGAKPDDGRQCPHGGSRNSAYAVRWCRPIVNSASQ